MAYTEGLFSGTPVDFVSKIIQFCTLAENGYTLTEPITGYGTSNTQYYRATIQRTVSRYGKTNTIYVTFLASGTSTIYDYKSSYAYSGIFITASYDYSTSGMIQSYAQATSPLNYNNDVIKCGMSLGTTNVPYFMTCDGNSVFIASGKFSISDNPTYLPYLQNAYWSACIDPSIGGTYVGGQLITGTSTYAAYVLCTGSNNTSGYYSKPPGVVIAESPGSILGPYCNHVCFCGAVLIEDPEYSGYPWASLVHQPMTSSTINVSHADTGYSLPAKNILAKGSRAAFCNIITDEAHTSRAASGHGTGIPSYSASTTGSNPSTGFNHNLCKWTGAFMPYDINISVRRFQNYKQSVVGTLPLVKYSGRYLCDYTNDITLSDGKNYKVCGQTIAEKSGTQVTL